MRVWASPDPTGATSVRELTSGSVAGATISLTGVHKNSSISWSPGTITLNNEFLFFQLEWQETVAGATGSDVLFQTGTTDIVAPDFTSYGGHCFFIAGTDAVTPNWFGNLIDAVGNGASVTANCAFGWEPSNNSIVSESYYEARLGATAVNTTYISGSDYISNTTHPMKGTGDTAATAGDSFITPTTYSGTFINEPWYFNFVFQATTIKFYGKINMRVWADTAATGLGARELTSGNVSTGIISLAATGTNYTAQLKWQPGTLQVFGEYLFFQIEWQETTVGTGGSILVFANSGTIVTPPLDPYIELNATGQVGIRGKLTLPSLPAAVSAFGQFGAFSTLSAPKSAIGLQSSGQISLRGVASPNGTLGLKATGRTVAQGVASPQGTVPLSAQTIARSTGANSPSWALRLAASATAFFGGRLLPSGKVTLGGASTQTSVAGKAQPRGAVPLSAKGQIGAQTSASPQGGWTGVHGAVRLRSRLAGRVQECCA